MMSALAFDQISIDPVCLASPNEITVDVLRLDKLNPIISGNKWFKLRYYLSELQSQRKKGIMTFGGAWSNHIIATAAICNSNGLSCVGLIRGEEPSQPSATLRRATELGMQLVYLPRDAYRKKEIPPQLEPEEYYLINEGGYGIAGARGASTILDYCTKEYTHYCCAVGTGTMMAGLINKLEPTKKILGISVMKNNGGLEQMVQALIGDHLPNWEINHEYSFGGYAKHNPVLVDFMNEFYRKTSIPTDFVYTGKLFYAIEDLAKNDYFPNGSRVLMVHSGGLQGNESLESGTLIF